LLNSFFKKAGEVLFGNTETSRTPKKRTRTLGIEELESRDLLSATPTLGSVDEIFTMLCEYLSMLSIDAEMEVLFISDGGLHKANEIGDCGT